MLVAPRVALLDPREVEERLGQVVAGRPLPALDLLPGLGPVLHVVSEAHLAAADRVQHPAGPPFHLLRDQRKAPLTIREASTSPGLRSSLAKTASTYGPFGTAGRSPGHERDRPATLLAVHRSGHDVLSGQVAVGDQRHVDSARRCEPVPLPEPRVDLHQLVAPVARIALELDLGDAVEAQRAQEAQPGVDDLLDPDRLADSTRPHHRRDLQDLPSREEPERLAVLPQVAAEAVQLVVAAGDQLLDHRCEVLGVAVGAVDLGSGLRAERLAVELPLEPHRMGRLDQDGVAELVPRRTRLGRRLRIARLGNVDAGLRRRLELEALVLDPFEHVPRRKGEAKPVEPIAIAGDRVERRVVGRQQDTRLLRSERFDECLRLDGRVRGGNGPGVARAKPERAGSMVDREHGDPGAPERADRRQPVHPGDV